MPIESGTYCQHCADAAGNLIAFEETFARMLEALEPGTWMFVDHPAYDDPEMRQVRHVGYEDVAVDRQGVVEAWTSPKAKEIVERRGIELIGYKDLVAK